MNSKSGRRIRKIDPCEAVDLITQLDQYQANLYPAESNHLDSIDTLLKPNVYMVGVFEKENLCAIGAVKKMISYGEIKRVYVPKNHRGKGFAKKIMAVLEQWLKDSGIFEAKLETGIYQNEAIGLYEGLGYVKCNPFGEYQPDPLSVFMAKKL